MLTRLAIICITGFWLAMTSLLVVRELYPESTRLNAVPASYVGQIVFQHEQTSDLRILTKDSHDGKDREIGSLQLQPSTLPGSGGRMLEIHGNATIPLPGGHHPRISWVANFEMSHSLTPEKLHVDLSTPEPGQRTDIAVDFVGKKAVFGVKIGDSVLSETAFTLDEAGFGSLMSRAGVDPMLLQQLKATQREMPQFDFSAQSSSLTIRGQKLETFLLVLKVGDQSLFEAQISQLGQVLSAQAPALGWKLTPFTR